MPKMTDDELRTIIAAEIAHADTHSSTEAEDRALALRYYLCDPNAGVLANRGTDRSAVVSSDVRDTVEWAMPSLMRIFASADKVVAFEPVGKEDIAAAEQETAVVNHVVLKSNRGFEVFYTMFKDALLSKRGIVKVCWEETSHKERESYENLTDDEFAKLSGDSDAKVVEHVERKQTPQTLGGVVFPWWTPSVHDATIERVQKRGQVKIENIPPEEFGVAIRARDDMTAPVLFHRTKKTVSELIEMGFDADKVRSLQTASDDPALSEEAQARRSDISGVDRTPSNVDDSMREVVVTEMHMLVDYNGDGVAERRTITVGGETADVILDNEEEDDHPFATICPAPLPHRSSGLSLADFAAESQVTNTVIFRQTLDNFYLTNNSRVEVPEPAIGDNTIDDLLTVRPGGIVRTAQGGMLQPLQVPTVLGPALTLMEFMSTVRENRTGITRYNQGLDANSLNKMLDIHTPVPMADGSYKLLRDILAGDLIVGASGEAVTVIAAHEIHEPVRAYRMTFASGDEIIAGGEHLWQVQGYRDRLRKTPRVINTDAVHAYMSEFSEALYVPRVERPQTGSGAELPVDPYLFGCWLGDGTSAKSAITTMDDEIVAAFSAGGWQMYADKTQNSGQATTWCIGASEAVSVRDGTNGRIVATGEAWLSKVGAAARNKHIPEVYHRAPRADRLELLRGLMDTDGCHHSGALAIFSQKAGRLLNDVVRLIESLGGWPSLTEVDPGDAGKEGQTYWNVTFHIFDNPFRLASKAMKWRPPSRNVDTQSIRAIEPVQVRAMRCLTVDAADGLFCVGRRFTVTHNTATGVQMIQNAAMQRLELIARIFAETGVKRMFLLVHDLLRKHSEKIIPFRLRGKWIEIDPRKWARRMDLTATVGLGTGNKEQQLAQLDGLLAIQQAIVQFQGGPNGPLVTLKNVHNTLEKRVSVAEIGAPDQFFTDPERAPPQQPQPNPEVEKAQAELQLEAQKAQQKAQLDQQTAQAGLALKAQEAEQEMALAERRLQHEMKLAEMRLAHEMRLADLKARADIAVKERTAEMTMAVKAATAINEPAAEEKTT